MERTLRSLNIFYIPSNGMNNARVLMDPSVLVDKQEEQLCSILSSSLLCEGLLAAAVRWPGSTAA